METIKKNFLYKQRFLWMMFVFVLSACGPGPGADRLELYTPTPDTREIDFSSIEAQSDEETILDEDAPIGIEGLPTEIVALLGDIEDDTEVTLGEIPDPTLYQWNIVAAGFNTPVLMTHAGDDSGRLFIVEQGGVVWALNQIYETYVEPFLDIQDRVLVSNEQGLLGLAFSPDFAFTGYVFVMYTDLEGNTVISRFTADEFGLTVDTTTEQRVLTIENPGNKHLGGQLLFDNDDFLLIGIGQGVQDDKETGVSQSLGSLQGKILRINVELRVDYTIPTSNPYFGLSGNEEIWASGLNNPASFSIDRETGHLYISDIGAGKWEEVNFLHTNTLGGSNFGWDYYAGTHIYQGIAPNTPFTDPFFEYEHADGTCAIVGGYVYRGANLPAWDGIYFYADRCTGRIWGALRYQVGTWDIEEIFDLDVWIAIFGQDGFGELYLADVNSGDIYRLDQR